jgi:hypothetical protein
MRSHWLWVCCLAACQARGGATAPEEPSAGGVGTAPQKAPAAQARQPEQPVPSGSQAEDLALLARLEQERERILQFLERAKGRRELNGLALLAYERLDEIAVDIAFVKQRLAER